MKGQQDHQGYVPVSRTAAPTHRRGVAGGRLRRVSGIALYTLLSFYAFCNLYPLFWMVSNSFKNNQEIFVRNVFGLPRIWRFENYIKAWQSFNIFLYFKNSMIVATATVVITLMLSIMFAYATARMSWKLSSIARIYMSIGMFVPVQVIFIPLVLLIRDFHLSNSYLALIVPYVAFQLSFCSIVFYGFFRTLPPELEEAAAIDGANVYVTFYRIILPLVKPAIATLAIFVFLFSWNEFAIALIMISNNSLKTLPLGLLLFQGQFATDWGAMGASLALASIPTIVVYLLFGNEVEKALTVGSAVKG
ncbi:MAG: carbohydrate ABC transporter permease [Bacillota bacterium]|nr:carbohydrate ABC transporter permease [Bacillota bacterium]